MCFSAAVTLNTSYNTKWCFRGRWVHMTPSQMSGGPYTTCGLEGRAARTDGQWWSQMLSPTSGNTSDCGTRAVRRCKVMQRGRSWGGKSHDALNICVHMSMSKHVEKHSKQGSLHILKKHQLFICPLSKCASVVKKRIFQGMGYGGSAMFLQFYNFKKVII